MLALRCLLFVGLCGVAVEAACSAADKALHNDDWMTQIAQSRSGLAFKDMKLKDIMFPGSHDSGTYDWPHNMGYSYYETQLAGMEKQLCRGARFFDLRVGYSHTYGAFYIFHGDGFTAHDTAVRRYGQRWKDVKEQILQFVVNPDYSGELVFLRLKIEASWTSTITEQWTKTKQNVSNHLVGDMNGDGNAGNLRVGQVVDLHKRGAKVFLLDFLGDGDKKYYTNTPEAFIWSYPASFSGKYSGSNQVGEVLFKDPPNCAAEPAKCSQATKRAAWVTAGYPTIHTFWWTMTYGDVQDHTRKQLQAYPTGPIDFYFLARGGNDMRMGTVIVTDFYADDMWKVPNQATGSHMILEICKHYITSKLGAPASLLNDYKPPLASDSIMKLDTDIELVETSAVAHKAARRLGRIKRDQRALQPLA